MLPSCTTAEWWYLGAGGSPVVKALVDVIQLILDKADEQSVKPGYNDKHMTIADTFPLR